LKIACAKSPPFPVTLITYCPATTKPIVKLPVTLPNPVKLPEVGMKTEQAALRGRAESELLMEHTLSVDRKCDPSTATDVPTGPLVV
jgi:hypothetical protein